MSLNLGFPALAVSSAMPYGSERIGQYGRSPYAEPQPQSTTASSFDFASSMCCNAPVCGPHRNEPVRGGTSSDTPSLSCWRMAWSG